MKKFKKITSIMLVLTMLFALACTAFADGPATTPIEGKPTGTGSVTNDSAVGSILIDNAVPNENYSIYQIFVLESVSGSSYSYSVAEDWVDFFVPATEEAPAPGADYVTLTKGVDGKYYVAWNAEKNSAQDLQDFANAALAWAQTQVPDTDDDGNAKIDEEGNPVVKDRIAATKTATATTDTVLFADLNLGYYLVTSTVGTLCSLDTTNLNVIIKEKNPASSIEKKIVTANGNVDSASYDIGDTVNFKLTVNIEAPDVVEDEEEQEPTGYAKNLKVKDIMKECFTFPAAADTPITVTVTDKDGKNIPVTEVSDYTLNIRPDYDAEAADEYGFTIAFKDETIPYGSTVTIEYSAVLNDKAERGATKTVKGENGEDIPAPTDNKNTAELYYGLDTTPKDRDEVKVYTVKITIDKVDGTDNTVKLLGAQFKLYKEVTEVVTPEEGEETTTTTTKLYYKWVDATEPVEGKAVEWVADAANADVVITDENGAAVFEGLKEGTYYLEEVKAPAGYNMLQNPVEVTVVATKDEVVDGDGVTEEPSTVSDNVVAQIANNAGTELPATGGMGTKIFITVGSIMLLGAGVLLVTKRRMSLIGD